MARHASTLMLVPNRVPNLADRAIAVIVQWNPVQMVAVARRTTADRRQDAGGWGTWAMASLEYRDPVEWLALMVPALFDGWSNVLL